MTKMLAPRDLMARYSGVMTCSLSARRCFAARLPVNGRLRGGERFEIELEDPEFDDGTLRHAYDVRSFETAD